ncbi:MAG: hypothetical protein J5I94_19565, partial [Phaeodactylibacter sp.]|nr:hypothetical protein [Phaeodactylibacter sp.]
PIAYPYFDDPMYEKVKELGADYLIPNLHLIPNNCITLLESNRAFIEAYMAGLNVEMGRELKWREYPTDERGSYFRQFWDVKGLMADPSRDFEKYKDITPIDQWAAGELGCHHPVSAERNVSDPLVLAIRGGLLQAFPNTVVYAVRAVASCDYLLDTQANLFVIKKRNTDSKRTEICIFSAASGYREILAEFNRTPLEETDETFEFLLNSKNDLFVIKKRNTGTKKTEVHIISSESDPRYSSFIFHKGTVLPETDDSFTFLLDAEENLYAIKKQNTGTNSTEVHILSRASNYQEFLLRTGTVLHPTDESFEFLLDAQNNLIAIKKQGTGSNSTEVHILSREHNYQRYVLNTGTALPETDAFHTFLFGPNADLFAIATGKNTPEVFLLPAADNYQSLEHKATLDIPTLKLGTDTVYPIFKADIEPDIKLLGFPFNKEQAEGSGKGNGLGYFFVLREIPGELRLGLDIGEPAPTTGIEDWDGLSWSYVQLQADSNMIDIGETPKVREDFSRKDEWGKNAATMARIFFQKPVMIAIHASEMLKGLKNEI